MRNFIAFTVPVALAALFLYVIIAYTPEPICQPEVVDETTIIYHCNWSE